MRWVAVPGVAVAVLLALACTSTPPAAPASTGAAPLNVASLKADQDWYAANSEIPTKIDVDRLVDHAFVEYAVQQLGSAR